MTEMQPVTNDADGRRDRPRQVVVVSILLALFGVLGWMMSALLVLVFNDDPDVAGIAYALVPLQFLLSSAQILSGVFVWRGRSWARKLAVAICGGIVAGAVLQGIAGAVQQAITGAALNLALVRLLLGAEVGAWCDRRPPSA